MTLFNFLKTQLGRSRIPLNYAVRGNDASIVRVNVNFLDDYVDQCPLQPAKAFDVTKAANVLLIDIQSKDLKANFNVLLA